MRIDWVDMIAFTLIAIIVLVFGVAIYQFPEEQRSRKAEKARITELCTKTPEHWDCQVYLAKLGKRDNSSSAMSGALIGTAIGMSMANSGRR